MDPCHGARCGVGHRLCSAWNSERSLHVRLRDSGHATGTPHRVGLTGYVEVTAVGRRWYDKRNPRRFGDVPERNFGRNFGRDADMEINSSHKLSDVTKETVFTSWRNSKRARHGCEKQDKQHLTHPALPPPPGRPSP